MYGRKRARTNSGAPSNASRRAAAISRRVNSKYPYSKYGRIMVPRGTADNISRFGATYRSANADQRSARKSGGYYGKGAYWGGRLGGMAAGAMGMDAGWGSRMGSQAENWLIDKGVSALQTYRGSGSYVTSDNINPRRSNLDNCKIMSMDKDDSDMRVTHREYCFDVQGTSTFSNTQYLINPMNSVLFPWLAQMANNFDEYQFEQIIFHFRPTVADSVVSTNQLGTVILAPQYNVGNSGFTTKIAAMEAEGSMSAKISDNLDVGIECDPRKNSGMGPIMFVLPTGGAVPSGQDVKSYYLAALNVAVNSSAVIGQIGEIWVDYSCVLRKKRYNSALALSSNPFTPFYYIAGVTGTGFNASNPLGAGGGAFAPTSNFSLFPNYNLFNQGCINLGVTTSAVITPALWRQASSVSSLLNQYAVCFSSASNNCYTLLPDNLPAGSYEMIIAFSGLSFQSNAGSTSVIGSGITLLSALTYFSTSASAGPGAYFITFTVSQNAASSLTGGPAGVGQSIYFGWLPSASAGTNSVQIAFRTLAAGGFGANSI